MTGHFAVTLQNLKPSVVQIYEEILNSLKLQFEWPQKVGNTTVGKLLQKYGSYKYCL